MADFHDVYDYDPTQQVWGLSMFANAVGQRSDPENTLQKEMEKVLPEALAKLGKDTDWKVGWGPKVYNAGRNIPMNVWYVATSEKQKRCVVAIAGTATKNYNAWREINFAVATVGNFSDWVGSWKATLDSNKEISVPKDIPQPGKAFCSYGTCLGVSNVLNLPSPASAAFPGKRLHQYLETVPAGYSVIFTGHSMGAALSPTLALGLIRANVAGLGSKSVRVYPSAGASPGNDTFSQMYGDLGPNVYNPNDVVAMAWGVSAPEDQNIGNIKTKIFPGARGMAKTIIEFTVPQATDLSNKSGVKYWPVKSEKIPTDTVKQPSDKPELFDEMHRQHVTLYLKYWGIEDLVKDYIRRIDKDLGPEAEIPAGDNGGSVQKITLVDGTECEAYVCN